MGSPLLTNSVTGIIATVGTVIGILALALLLLGASKSGR